MVLIEVASQPPNMLIGSLLYARIRLLLQIGGSGSEWFSYLVMCGGGGGGGGGW